MSVLKAAETVTIVTCLMIFLPFPHVILAFGPGASAMRRRSLFRVERVDWQVGAVAKSGHRPGSTTPCGHMSRVKELAEVPSP